MNSAILDRLKLGLVLLVLSGVAWGDLVIRVTQGNDSPTKIAIAPIANAGDALTEDMARIVEADLQRSGLFAVTPREDMLSYPTMVKDVYYRDWRLVGSEYLVVGDMTRMQDGRYAIDFSLLSVTAQKPVFRHQVSGSAEQMRDLSHLISDKVYREITGIPGIFSTRIAYVTATQIAERMTYRLHVADADGSPVRPVTSAEPPPPRPSDRLLSFWKDRQAGRH